jgi:hypothetical protein
MKSQDVLPVILSIVVIVLVAILEKQSKLLAAVTATMPLTAPLAIWIVHSSSGGERAAVTNFSFGLLLSVFPSLGFLLTVWIASRAGMKLLPMLFSGYGVWVIGVLILFMLKKTLGLQ